MQSQDNSNEQDDDQNIDYSKIGNEEEINLDTAEGADDNLDDDDAELDEDGKKKPKMVSQEVFEKVIDKKVAKAKSATEEAAEYKRKYEELRDKYKPDEVIDPDPPDVLDKDYDAKILEWKNTVISNAQKRDSQKPDASVTPAKTVVSNKLVDAYTKRAKEFKVDTEDLFKRGRKMVAHGLGEDVSRHILKHPKGPLITTYLTKGANLAELATVVDMDPMDAVAYLASSVVPKLKSSKKKKQPNTSEGITPSSAPAAKSRHVRAAKFE